MEISVNIIVNGELTYCNKLSKEQIEELLAQANKIKKGGE